MPLRTGVRNRRWSRVTPPRTGLAVVRDRDPITERVPAYESNITADVGMTTPSQSGWHARRLPVARAFGRLSAASRARVRTTGFARDGPRSVCASAYCLPLAARNLATAGT